MSKQIFKIPGFHGGLNTHSDPRDIMDEECSLCIGFDVSKPGMLRFLGHDKTTATHDAGSGVGKSFTVNIGARASGYGAYDFQHEKRNMCEHMGLYFRHTQTDDSYRVAIPGNLADSGDYAANPWDIPDDVLINMRIRNYGQNTQGRPAWGTVTDNTNYDSTETNITVTTGAMSNGAAVTGSSDDHWQLQADGLGNVGIVDGPPGGGESYALCGWSTDTGNAGVEDGLIVAYNRTRTALSLASWSSGLMPMHTGNEYVIPLFWEAEGRLFCQNIESYGNPAVNADSTLNTVDQEEIGSTVWNSYNSHYEVQYLRQRCLLQDTAEGTNVAYAQRFKYPGLLGADYDGWISSHWPIHKTRPRAYSHDDNGARAFHRIYWGEGANAPDKGGCLKLQLIPATSGDAGTWLAAGSDASPPSYYELYVTQYNQYGEESMMRICGADNDSTGGNDGLRFSLPSNDPENQRMVGRVMFNFSEAWADPNSYNQPFEKGKSCITSGVGARYYISHYPDYPNERYLLLDANLEKGVKVAGTDESWTRWEVAESGSPGAGTFGDYDGAIATNYGHVDIDIKHPPNLTTFEDLNGYRHDDDMVGQYKCAAVVGKTSYVGNIINYTTGQVNDDAIAKSPVGKYGVHPWRNRIEVVPMDGDMIMQLASYAERLLIFKRRKLHILNCSQEVEYLEDTMDFGGISHPNLVVSTEEGVFWANRWGAWMYNGERVVDLFRKEGRILLSKDTWEDFFEEPTVTSAGLSTGGSIAGYDPAKKWFFVVKNCTQGSGHGDAFVLDLPLQAWMKSTDVVDTGSSGGNITNIFNSGSWKSSDSPPCYFLKRSGVELELKQMDLEVSAATNYSGQEWASKDFDFGAPGVRKKIYKVYISYKGDARNMGVFYGVNGENDFALTGSNPNDLYTFNSDSTPLENKSSTEDLEKWNIAELKPTTTSQANNIYSFQLVLKGLDGIPGNFKINDISIVYRNKRVK